MIELMHRLQAHSYRMLESRVVFDGAAADTAQQVADAPDAAEPADGGLAPQAAGPDLGDVLSGLASAPQAAETASRTIVFIDGSVSDAGVIASAVPPGADVFVLDRGQDGVLQISQALEGLHNIDAIHIVSHGLEGELRLGTATLDANSIQGQYASLLAAIGQSLSADADILIYGCDFTKGDQGQQTAQLLSQITGADIAASVDDTGSAVLGGNWTLETHVGDIDAVALDAPEWNGILAPLVISATSGPATSGGTGLGATGLWQNAGHIGSTSIDIRATVTSATAGVNVQFNIQGDDLWLLIENGTVTVKWEIFASGTSQSVVAVGDPNFRIRDIDGINNVALPFPLVEIEAVSPNLRGLTSYTVEAVTNLDAGISGSNLVVRGTRDQDSENTSQVAFDWTGVSSWEVTYTAVVGQNQRWFFHDGDGDFTFVDPNTTYMLGLDLDANNSTATGNNYRNTFVEQGSAVSIVDTDVSVSQQYVLGSDLGHANVVLTNAQAGDELLVNGSSAASGTVNGLSYTISSSGGQIAITLTGEAPLSTYQTALQAITFRNTQSDPVMTDRVINVTVTNDTFATTSNVAVSTIAVNRQPDPIDPDPTPGTPYLDPLNPSSGIIVPATDNIALSLDLDQYFTDPNGDPLTFSPNLSGLPGWLSYNATTHVFSGTPPVDNVGDVSIAVTVADNRGGSIAATITIRPVNPGPDAVDGTSLIQAGSTLALPLLANDTDPDGDPLTVVTASVANPAHGTVAFDGSNWVFTPATGFTGVATINYTIRDQDGATDSATHTVNVNAAPTPDDPDPTPGTPYLDPLNPTRGVIVPATDNVAVSINLTQYFTDPNGDPLTFTVNTATLPSWLSWNPATKVLSGTPPVDNIGDFIVPVTVADNRGGSIAATVTFTPVNPGPDAVDGTSLIQAGTPFALPLLANDTDPDGDPLTVVTASVVNPAHGTVAFDGSNWVFTPATGFTGVATINYTIRDQDGATDSASHTVDVNAAPTPDDPDPTPGTPYLDPLNPTRGVIVPATDNVAVSINLTQYFTDPNGDPLTFTVNTATLPSWLSWNPSTKVLSGTPPVDNIGDFIVPVTVADNRGGSIAATVTFAPVNPGPDAVDGTSLIQEGTPLALPLLANDTDPDGDPLTVVTASVVNPAHGTVSFDGSNWVFTPATGFTGVATINYTIRDQDGATDSASHTVDVNAAPTPDDPDPTPGTPYLDPLNPTRGVIVPATDNVTVSINLTQYFTDPNGDPLTFTVNTATLPSWLSWNPATKVLSGTPPVDNIGDFIVPVTVADNRGGSIAATVTFAPVNPGPDAQPGTTPTAYGKPVVVDLMANDTDPDGDPIVVTAASVPSSQGSVAFNGRDWVFTPASGFSGTASITYTIRDQDGATSMSTHEVVVAQVEPPPFYDPGQPQLPGGSPRPTETVEADGMVLDTVRDAGDLSGISGIKVDGIVVDTVNSFGGLGGLTSVSQDLTVAYTAVQLMPGVVVDTHAAHITASTWDAQGMSGFSLRMPLSEGRNAGAQVIVETLVREETLIIQISSHTVPGAKAITGYRLLDDRGGPAPAWLDQIGKDLAVGRRPADSESVSLRIVVVYADGSSETKSVRIETVNGEIKPEHRVAALAR